MIAETSAAGLACGDRLCFGLQANVGRLVNRVPGELGIAVETQSTRTSAKLAQLLNAESWRHATVSGRVWEPEAVDLVDGQPGDGREETTG